MSYREGGVQVDKKCEGGGEKKGKREKGKNFFGKWEIFGVLGVITERMGKEKRERKAAFSYPPLSKT